MLWQAAGWEVGDGRSAAGRGGGRWEGGGRGVSGFRWFWGWSKVGGGENGVNIESGYSFLTVRKIGFG